MSRDRRYGDGESAIEREVDPRKMQRGPWMQNFDIALSYKQALCRQVPVPLLRATDINLKYSVPVPILVLKPVRRWVLPLQLVPMQGRIRAMGSANAGTQALDQVAMGIHILNT